MAKIIKANGQEVETEPINGTDFQLEELKDIVKGWIEIVWLPDGRLMCVNEEGKCYGLPINDKATEIYQSAFGYSDFICGDVLVCDGNQIQ